LAGSTAFITFTSLPHFLLPSPCSSLLLIPLMLPFLLCPHLPFLLPFTCVFSQLVFVLPQTTHPPVNLFQIRPAQWAPKWSFHCIDGLKAIMSAVLHWPPSVLLPSLPPRGY
jgi:hypothetical protein